VVQVDGQGIRLLAPALVAAATPAWSSLSAGPLRNPAKAHLPHQQRVRQVQLAPSAAPVRNTGECSVAGLWPIA